VYHLTGNLLLCYNLLFLSTFVLSGLGMYLLVREFTGNRWAAFLAGLLFAFVPIRIGEATVSPGDLVLGDREGVYFIPPSLVQGILDRADETHIHDEWTKRKFDEGKYKSQEIYGSPRDPALKKEYEDYLAKKLAELKSQRAQKK
jgi:hypothetical protein